ncbi:MAG: DUF4112 domain-containing protein [Nitrospiraceae bacterium]
MTSHPQPIVPIEVLPRDEAREHLLAIADILAKVLDTTIRIPGTSWYIGLDPLLGLIPGIGDVIANLTGTVILGIATRLQIPRIVLTRMSLNLLINGTVGAVPILGDLFSVWFRSHARNAALLREAAMKPERETHADWFYVVGIIGGTVALLLLAIAFIVWLVFKLWAMISGG